MRTDRPFVKGNASCITFVQRQPNVFDVGPTLYKCYTNILCLLGNASHNGRYKLYVKLRSRGCWKLCNNVLVNTRSCKDRGTSDDRLHCLPSFRGDGSQPTAMKLSATGRLLELTHICYASTTSLLDGQHQTTQLRCPECDLPQ